MGWIEVPTDDGSQWQVNQDGLYLMARSSVRASLARRYTSEIRSGEGWFDGPEIVEIHTDWGHVNRETDRAALDLYNALAHKTMQDPAAAARNITQIVASTRTNQAHLRELQSNAMSRNMGAVDRHVNRWENAVAVTRFIRDASWTTLIVLSAIPSGGSSVAAGGATAAAGASAAPLATGVNMFGLTAGSIGRGHATYQDTGNVGAAVLSGTGSFITGAMGLPTQGVSAGSQAVLLGVQSVSAGGFAGLQGIVEGKDGETAAWQAVSAAGFNLVGGRMSTNATFQNMSAHVQVTLQVGVDMAGNQVTSAIGNSSSTPPRSTGRMTFSGVPSEGARDATHVRDTILRPL